ncbi:MAG: UDP-N-acetylmuramoyl-tripeptide--D-alanyl-D-alanine ligase [SAR324 cluster bacterium]|nr:UDP-N-acetylmuramoyl-tripeptide--D-alanyl-D-alanine ligase [SAR324 cluster bacterium]
MAKLYTFREMRQIINAKLEYIDPDSSFNDFSIDSRTVKDGDVFFCIKGEMTDGHQYISQALEKGASAVVANPETIPDALQQREFPKILVPDPNLALREWASDARKNFEGKVLAVTGSNGKTSTKEILSGLCSFFDSNAYATPGNYNNYIGVPLTLLDAPTEAEWWVIEIGSNNFGEIAELSKIVRPTGGVITNIGESHLEFLLDTKGVAREKSGLFAGMAQGSKVVIPESILHQEIVEKEAEKAGVELIKTAKIAVESKKDRLKFNLFDADFETAINNPLFLQNLVSSLTLLRLQGLSVPQLQKATANLELNLKGRFHTLYMKEWILIDDTYNANPSSFKSVLENMKNLYPQNRKIVVCGKMAELGQKSPELHQQVGINMVKNGVEIMLGLGGEEIESYIGGWKKGGGSMKSAKQFTELVGLLNAFKQELKPGDVVLVKGSRSARMERFVENIR